MKKLYIFTWPNCTNCAALKPKLKKLYKSKYELHYFDMDDNMRPFRDWGVQGIPTVLEVFNGKEVEGTRQVWVIDLSKY